MRKFVSTAIIIAALLTAACDGNLRFADGTPAPEPTVQMSEDRWEVVVSFDRPASPTIEHWKNGLIVMNCPIGYRFDFINQRTDRGEYFQQSICVPNPVPADVREVPDPTRSADGRDG